MIVCDLCRKMYTDSSTGRSTMIRPTQTVTIELAPAFAGNPDTAMNEVFDVCGECQSDLRASIYTAINELTTRKQP